MWYILQLQYVSLLVGMIIFASHFSFSLTKLTWCDICCGLSKTMSYIWRKKKMDIILLIFHIAIFVLCLLIRFAHWTSKSLFSLYLMGIGYTLINVVYFRFFHALSPCVSCGSLQCWVATSCGDSVPMDACSQQRTPPQIMHPTERPITLHPEKPFPYPLAGWSGKQPAAVMLMAQDWADRIKGGTSLYFVNQEIAAIPW